MNPLLPTSYVRRVTQRLYKERVSEADHIAEREQKLTMIHRCIETYHAIFSFYQFNFPRAIVLMNSHLFYRPYVRLESVPDPRTFLVSSSPRTSKIGLISNDIVDLRPGKRAISKKKDGRVDGLMYFDGFVIARYQQSWSIRRERRRSNTYRIIDRFTPCTYSMDPV